MNKYLISTLIFFISFPDIVSAQYFDEIELKAFWFEKFARYVEWPENNNTQDNSLVFVIKILGESPFRNTLQKYYIEQKNKIKNRTVEIKYISRTSEIIPCNLLFVSESKEDELEMILNKIKNLPILIIGDTNGFAKKGVHINFVLKQERLLFEINEKAIHQSTLKMDYELRAVALRIINPIK